MNPEIYTFLFPRLLESGALDVFLTSIVMKKNRPGITLSVLCKERDCDVLEEILFTETTTLGLRKYPVERDELEREHIKVSTKYGQFTVKAAYKNGKLLKYAPEYEECSQAALHHGEPIREIYNEVLLCARHIRD